MEKFQKEKLNDKSLFYYLASDKENDLTDHCQTIYAMPAWSDPYKNRVLFRREKYYTREGDTVHELNYERVMSYTGTMRIVCTLPDDYNITDPIICFDQVREVKRIQTEYSKQQLKFYCVPGFIVTFAISSGCHQAEFADNFSSVSDAAGFNGVIVYRDGKMYLQYFIGGELKLIAEKNRNWGSFEYFVLLSKIPTNK